MAISSAERQKLYRKRAFEDPNGLQLTRLQVSLSPSAKDALDRLVKQTGLTKRGVVEWALLLTDRKVEQEATEQEAAEQALKMMLESDVTV